jgi:hypothetical protein
MAAKTGPNSRTRASRSCFAIASWVAGMAATTALIAAARWDSSAMRDCSAS